jgi:hypothetical protein
VSPKARRQLDLAAVAVLVVVLAGSALPWLLPEASLDQVESVLRSGQAVTLFAAASLGLLSGRWVARTSGGFACATLIVR